MQLIIVLTALAPLCMGADILMVTMGGTKSHKIPFWELAKGLIPRGHNVTFLNGFPPDFNMDGLHEITPAGLVNYIVNYTNWDLLGARMRGDMPLGAWDVLRYGFEACDATLSDAEALGLLNRKFDLMIMDGAYPQCALGLQYRMGIPFMYINTVAFFTGTLALAGNPAPYSVTPVFYKAGTDSMNLWQRFVNSAYFVFMEASHMFTVTVIQSILRRHLGDDIPHTDELSKNVSFILQNGHATVTYPRPFLPNVAEVACIHCKPADPLPKDLEDFVNGAGDAGFIYVSMGSSVKAANMPDSLRRMLVQAFAKLPFRVLWKWETGMVGMHDLPSNVKLQRWLPQQDILGHPKLRAFVTHGGLLSMFETVYHGVPVVTIPVFCDHDANAAKAEVDGYALVVQLTHLTSDKLVKAIYKVIHDPSYRHEAKRRQLLLTDQRTTPLETAIYWTEYVLRHKGAYHLQSPARHLGSIQYYGYDIVVICVVIFLLLRLTARKLFGRTRKTPPAALTEEEEPNNNILKLKAQ